MRLSRSSVMMLGLALAARAAASATPTAAAPPATSPGPAAIPSHASQTRAATPTPAAPPTPGVGPEQARAGTRTAPQRPPLASPHAKITVNAMSSELDAKTGRVELIGNVVVSEGNTQVRADRADTTCLAQSASPSTQCANSRWTFQGNVQIEAPPRGSLQSDQAVVDIRNNRIARATILGNPAVFEQQHTSALGMTRGHADQIVYDVTKGTVSLIKDAWLSLSGGSNDITSQQIVYDIRSEKVQATSPGTQGVHITLTPQSLPKQASKHRPRPAKAAPAAPGAPQPPKTASPGGKSAAHPEHPSPGGTSSSGAPGSSGSSGPSGAGGSSASLRSPGSARSAGSAAHP